MDQNILYVVVNGADETLFGDGYVMKRLDLDVGTEEDKELAKILMEQGEPW